MNLSIKRLRAFVTVASLQSFTEAASRLHITQSALSALVKELEREVEISLFNRTTRSVELTPAGRKFLPHAEQAIVSFNDAIHGAKSLTRRPRNAVTLCAPQLTSCALLIPVIARFVGQNAGVDVMLDDAPVSEIPLRILVGEADLGITPDRVLDPELERTPLLTDILHVACRPDIPLARQKCVTWSELREAGNLITAHNFATRARIDLGVAADNLHPAYEVSHLITAFAMVRAGRGITVGPAHAAKLAETLGLVMRPLAQPEVVREFAIVTRRGRPLSAAASAFVAFLLDCAANNWEEPHTPSAGTATRPAAGKRSAGSKRPRTAPSR
jgi:DNA-binding transcriptional LysR family regulator